MFYTDIRDEMAIGDVVEGEKRGGEADDKEFLQGKESEIIWTVFA